MNEKGEFAPEEASEQESQEPTPEQVGEALRALFIETARGITEKDQEAMKAKLAESHEWLFVPGGGTERQEAQLDEEKIEYDLTQDLEVIIGQICDIWVRELQFDQREISEILEDACNLIESLGGDSSSVIEKLIEIGALE
jgi:hypothetical protein